MIPYAVATNPNDFSIVVVGRNDNGGVTWKRFSSSGTVNANWCTEGSSGGGDGSGLLTGDDDLSNTQDDEAGGSTNLKPNADESGIALAIFAVAIIIVGASGCVFFYCQRAKALQEKYGMHRDEYQRQRQRTDMAEVTRLNNGQSYQMASRDFQYEF